MLDKLRLSARQESGQPPLEELIQQNAEAEEVRQDNRQDDRPDYPAMRDRVLGKLKMGRQSAAGKALDLLIKELTRDQTGTLE